LRFTISIAPLFYENRLIIARNNCESTQAIECGIDPVPRKKMSVTFVTLNQLKIRKTDYRRL